MKQTPKKIIAAGFACLLCLTGCGSSGTSGSTASSAASEQATVDAADNLVGSGAVACDASAVEASYDANGKGYVTSSDGTPVTGTAADTSATGSDTSGTSSEETTTDETTTADTTTDGTTTTDTAATDGTTATDTATTDETTATDTATTDGTASDGTTTDESVTDTSSSSDNTSSGTDFSITPDSENQKAALCLASLDNITWTSGVTSFGGYTPSSTILQMLQETTTSAETTEKNIGYMIIDLDTCAGVCYESESHFYASRAAAAAFILGTLDDDPDSLTNSGEEFQIVAANTDQSQDTYTTLMNTYGFDPMYSWMNACGVDTTLDGLGGAFLSAEDLTRIWLRNYQYFTTDTNGSTVETWFENPSDSSLRTALGSYYTTWSLPGSYDGGSDAADYDATVEAGIVCAGDHPYVIAIVSDYAASPDKLVPLIQALNACHNEIVEVAGLS